MRQRRRDSAERVSTKPCERHGYDYARNKCQLQALRTRESTKREATCTSIRVDVQLTLAPHSGRMPFPRRYDANLPQKRAHFSIKNVQETATDHYLADPPPRTSSPLSKRPQRDDVGLEQEHQRFRPPHSSDVSWSKAPSSPCKYCGSRYSFSCILALLPGRETCEQLCSIFFSTVFPLMPVLHLQGFAHDFHAFWEGRDSSIGHDAEIGLLLRRKPGFVCLLSSILFASLVSAPPARLASIVKDDQDLTPEKMHFVAMVAATLTGFPRRPSLYTLAAYIIAQNQSAREEDFSDGPDFISTAFRFSIGMGLHRQLPNAGFTIPELETRRRLWWYILHLDVMSSASSGLSPLFIDDKMANANTISHHDQHENDPEDQSYQSQYKHHPLP